MYVWGVGVHGLDTLTGGGTASAEMDKEGLGRCGVYSGLRMRAGVCRERRGCEAEG